MSTTLTRADVTRIADLARLELTTDELDLFTRQLGDILGYVEQIREHDVREMSRMLYPEGIEIGLVPAIRIFPSFCKAMRRPMSLPLPTGVITLPPVPNPVSRLPFVL